MYYKLLWVFLIFYVYSHATLYSSSIHEVTNNLSSSKFSCFTLSLHYFQCGFCRNLCEWSPLTFHTALLKVSIVRSNYWYWRAVPQRKSCMFYSSYNIFSICRVFTYLLQVYYLELPSLQRIVAVGKSYHLVHTSTPFMRYWQIWRIRSNHRLETSSILFSTPCDKLIFVTKPYISQCITVT